MLTKFITGIVCLTSVFIFSVTASSAQVTGKIIEESTGSPLEYVNITLFSIPDSTFVSGTFSGGDGLFLFEKVNSGKYLLKVSYVGLENRTIQVDVSANPVNLGDIPLKELNVLREVVVTSKTPPFQSSINGGIVANVSTTLLSTVGTANDVLQRMPGIAADNGKITVFGKGAPIVYINNRKVRDVSELERLESSEISTVELITNPGAKYDAEGRAVLLIKTKTKIKGFSVQATERLRQGKYLGNNENISLSNTHERLNIFATLVHNYDKQSSIENHYLTLKNESDVWRHETFLPDNINLGNKEQISGGIDYSLSNKHTFGSQYQYFTINQKRNFRNNTTTYLNNMQYETSDAHTGVKDNGYQHLVNAFYNGDFSKRFSLHFDFDYLKNHDYSEQTSAETINDSDMRQVDIFNQTDYDLWAGKLINSWKLGVGIIEFGGEYNYIAGKGYVHSSGYTDNSEFSNTEQKAAGFISYTQKISALNFVAGLRYEYTQEKFAEGTDNKPFLNRSYNDWYPNISLSTAVKGVDLNLSFNKRTKRPSFSQLNGNVVYVNRFVFQKGNPYLNKANFYEISFQTIRKPIYLNISYEYQETPIVNAFRVQGNDKSTVLSTYDNFPKYRQLSAMLNFNRKIAFWQPNYTIGYIKPYFTTIYDSKEVAFNRPFGLFTAYNDFTLPHGFVLSCNFRYRTDVMQYYIESKDTKKVDIGLRKSLLNNSLRLNLTVYDLFDWTREQATIKYDYVNWVTDKKYETRYATLSISYLFNNYKKKYRGGSAAGDDINRF